MSLLHLTEAEQAIWRSLPGKLREGWEVQSEIGFWRDSPERRRMRMQLMHLHDPKLLKFTEKAKSARTAEELSALIGSTDLKGVSDSDLAELFFALGPAAVGKLIESMLKEAKSDDHLKDIEALATIRRALFASMSPAPAHSA